MNKKVMGKWELKYSKARSLSTYMYHGAYSNLGLHLAYERERYFVATSLIGWVQA